jgi:hypothetical protein
VEGPVTAPATATQAGSLTCSASRQWSRRSSMVVGDVDPVVVGADPFVLVGALTSVMSSASTASIDVDEVLDELGELDELSDAADVADVAEAGTTTRGMLVRGASC